MHGGSVTRALTASGVAVLIGALMVLAAPSALAHTLLLSSVPAAGSMLATAPSEVVLTFDEPVQATTLQLAVTASSGATVSRDKPVVAGTVVTQPLPSTLPNDTYTLAYRLVSVDGHPATNSVTFIVNDPASTAAPIASSSSADASAASGSSHSGRRGFGAVLGGVIVLAVAFGIVALSRRFARRARP